MTSTNQYGQYRFELLKGIPPGCDLTNLDYELLQAVDPMKTIREKDIEAVQKQLILEQTIYGGKGDHIFLSKEAQRVALNSVRKLTIPELSRFVPSTQAGVLYVEGDDPCLFLCMNRSNRAYIFFAMEKYGSFTSIAEEGEDYPEDHTNMTPEEEDTLQQRLRLIYGFLLLTREFPELMVDGPPEKVKHPAWYRKHKSKQHLRIDRVRGERAPHLRHGHFRLLKSERFVHKRGQLVFVKPSMVKGKAKHDKTGGINRA